MTIAEKDPERFERWKEKQNCDDEEVLRYVFNVIHENTKGEKMIQEVKGWSDCENFITAQSEKALNYGEQYNSALELYAVMKQELEEVSDEVKYMKELNGISWDCLKQHHYNESCIDGIEECACKGMIELAQVIAVCRKAKSGFKGDK